MTDILVVEDDPAILKGLETNLRFEGYQVRSVARGDTAIESVSEQRPDLVILDVMLPGVDGFEVCRRLRTKDPRMPILLLTARSEEVDRVRGLDLGADDYLTKPFGIAELLARVRSLIRRAGASRGDALPSQVDFRDVHVDFEGFQATKAGQAVHLTAKEFGLLRCLVANGDKVLGRESILTSVWGDEVNVTNRTVDTHVLALRQKLEDDPANPQHLLTVHGVGYRFCAGRRS